MKKLAILLAIYVSSWALSPPIHTQEIPGSIDQTVGLPVSEIPSEIPSTLPEEARHILESDPEKKRIVDEFLQEHELPPSDKITDEELADLIDELDDPRGQPVDPSDAGPILVQAWKAIHPNEPVPPEIANLEKEETCSGALRSDGGTSPFDPANFPDTDSISNAVKIIDGYLNVCLQTPDSLGDIRKWLDGVVGVLRYEDAESESCIATLVGPKHVLTARHCLFQPNNGKWYPLAWTTLDFFLPVRETDRRRVVEIIEPPGTTPDEFLDKNDEVDWVILVLSDPILTVNVLALEELHDLDKLVLYSKQPLVYHRDKLAETIGSAKLASTLVDHIRVDRGESCRSLVKTANGCVTHGCQSEGGVSGAPLLRFSPDGKSLSIVAIHQGEVSSSYTGTCLPANQPRLPNRGRVVTSDLITAIRNATNTQ